MRTLLVRFGRIVAAPGFRTAVRWAARAALAVAAVLTMAGLDYYRSVALPNDPVAPQASEILFRDGHTLLARVGTVDRTEVGLDQIPLPVRRAVLAAEDREFYHHFGLSIRGVLRAAWANATGGGSEGASTITQQYARNAYLTQERTLDRKSREVVLALKLERRYGKDEILRRYLNAIYFGRQAYGISAAAWAYFGVPPERLTLAQGAVLAAVIKDPWHFDPAVDTVRSRARWQWVISAMDQLGWLPAGEEERLRYPTVLAEPPVDTTPAGANGLVVAAIERELGHAGISPQRLHTAGLRVVSTIDVRAQQAAHDAVAGGLAGLDHGIHAALVAIEPGTGSVVAYFGGDRGAGFFDDATAPRRAASTFKPLVLAAGLNHGVAYDSLWDGSSPRTFPDRGGVPLRNANDAQCPACPLWQAMVASLNTPFYALAQRLGGGAVRDVALALGIPPWYDGAPSLVDGPDDPRPGHTRADIAIGAYPVAPVDLATVYATFAAGGVRAERHIVASVWRGHEQWYAANPARTKVLDPAVAADVGTVLARVADVDGQPVGHRAAGKTGTQQFGNTTDNQDAWMAGYTPRLAAVVWLGRPVPGPIRDATGAPIQGAGRPAAIWRAFLGGALAGQPSVALPPPAHVGDVATGDARGSTPTRPRPG